ncbi:divalent-cation tolerance protein CutA [Streptomyces sp. NBC_01233]|uniref:divalent-cation tolerance protein CutA n=1 Tax=Streptomyces sp. NBC_01233 TaxID=2903787 RepID=UPI002E0E250D|nr:divalent-cation tolerance protein CutA [Streptomyces sp. NBC_01233]
MANIVIAQTTVNDEGKAYDIGRAAVEARLTAGVHIDARMTTFSWEKGAVQHERGYRLSFQTTTGKVAALKAWVHEQHPHDVPQWIVLPSVEASEEYLAWAVKETTAG